MSELIEKDRKLPIVLGISLVLHLVILTAVMIINPSPTKARLQPKGGKHLVTIKYATSPKNNGTIGSSSAVSGAPQKVTPKSSPEKKATPAKPVVKKPPPKKPVVQKPEPKKPVVQKPEPKKPEPKKPVVQKPEPKKPVVQKPEPKKPVVQKPIPKKNIVAKPVFKPESSAKNIVAKPTLVQKKVVMAAPKLKSKPEAVKVSQPKMKNKLKGPTLKPKLTSKVEPLVAQKTPVLKTPKLETKPSLDFQNPPQMTQTTLPKPVEAVPVNKNVPVPLQAATVLPKQSIKVPSLDTLPEMPKATMPKIKPSLSKVVQPPQTMTSLPNMKVLPPVTAPLKTVTSRLPTQKMEVQPLDIPVPKKLDISKNVVVAPLKAEDFELPKTLPNPKSLDMKTIQPTIQPLKQDISIETNAVPISDIPMPVISIAIAPQAESPLSSISIPNPNLGLGDGLPPPSGLGTQIAKEKYGILIAAAIKSNYAAPDRFRKDLLTRVLLTIGEGSELLDYQVVQSSGVKAFDQIALVAVETAEIPTLMEELPVPYQIIVEFTP